jgi:hypothetical protein
MLTEMEKSTALSLVSQPKINHGSAARSRYFSVCADLLMGQRLVNLYQDKTWLPGFS